MTTKTKERGLIVSDWEANAIREGRKTQRRQVAKLETDEAVFGWGCIGGQGFGFVVGPVTSRDDTRILRHPFGELGDRLWLREAWKPYACGDESAASMHIEYRADANDSRDNGRCITFEPDEFFDVVEKYINPTLTTEIEVLNEEHVINDGCEPVEERRTFIDPDKNPWRPSISMPRWAARTVVELVSVRVERLEDISEKDARAEGALAIWIDPETMDNLIPGHYSHREGFYDVWNNPNAKKGNPWKANPWVWVPEFKVIEGAA